MRPRLFLTTVVALSALTSCAEPPEVETILRPVRYTEVTRSSEARPRTLAGVVRSGVESRLSFRVAGSIEWLGVQIGDVVSKGQELARLDPVDYELRVEEARAALAQSEANLRKAEADLERVRGLYENNNASKSELDAARAAFESASAQQDARTRQLDQSRQQVGYTSLLAPADGAIASVAVEVNENVNPGEEICLLVSGSDPEVAVAVPGVMIGSISVGQAVTVRLDAMPGELFAAEVREVGVAVTGAATTFVVTARFLDWNRRIRSGMAAEVTFDLSQPADDEQIVVPGVAVGEDRQGRFVFVLQDESEGQATVRRRPVEIGPPRASGVVILQGLTEGERIATAGVRRLTDGQRVLLQGDSESE